MTEALVILMYWVIYFTLHSVLASFWFKGKVENLWPKLFTNYRIIYNTISLIGLGYILFYLATTPSDYLLQKNEILQFIGLALATWGLIFLRLSFKEYSIRKFLGLKQTEFQTGQELSVSGVLKRVRHPIYTGTILVVLGFFLFNPKVLNLVTLVAVLGYILIGIQLEERKLIQEFGDDYEEYRKQVPMLIPRFW